MGRQADPLTRRASVVDGGPAFCLMHRIDLHLVVAGASQLS
jgi:hypothetical protein